MKLPAKNCAVLDFDGTCIPRAFIALIPIVDRNALPEEASEDLAKVWEIYGDKAVNGTISQVEARAWIVQTVDLYIRYGLKLEDAYRALDHVRLKPGFKKFLRDMHRLGVPVAINSFGIKQFIWYVLQKEGVGHLVSDIFATDVVTWNISKNAKPISDFDLKSMVVPHFKGCFSEIFAWKYGVPDEGIIAVGDSLGDALLGVKKVNRICLIEKESEIEKYGLDEHFGEILITKSFVPAHEAVLRRLKP